MTAQETRLDVFTGIGTDKKLERKEEKVMEKTVYEVISFRKEVSFNEVEKGKFIASGYELVLKDGVSQEDFWELCDAQLVARFKNELDAIDFLRENCNASVEAFKSNGLMIVNEVGVFEMIYDDENVELEENDYCKDTIVNQPIEFTTGIDWEYVERCIVNNDEEVNFSNAHDLERKFDEMIDEAIRYDVDIEKEDLGDCYSDDLIELRNKLKDCRYLSEVDDLYEELVDHLKGYEN